MKYKKGQIIPRRFVRAKSQKTQHLNKFGADVEIKGRTITMLSDGTAIHIGGSYVGGRKGKPRVYNRVYISNINVIGIKKGEALRFNESSE